MFCPICGKENPEGSTFCAGCGKPIAGQAAPAAAPVAAPVAPQPAPQAQPQQQYAAPQQQYAQPQYAAPQAPVAPAAPAKPSPILPFGQFFKSLLTAAFKPVTGAADEAKKYDHIGNSLILSAIVVGILTIANFLLYILRTTIYNSWPRNAGDTFVRILRNFTGSLFDYALMTFGFAGIMLVIGLILKEKWSFSRLLAITSMAVFPSEAVRVLVIKFFTTVPSNADTLWYYTMLKYFPISSVLSAAATIYAFILLYEGITRETKLEGNKKGFIFAIAWVALEFVSHYIGLIY
ncbi:MAG: zinc ribbon domain-containing protein [Clostridiales bacterium]|nr:zinc ribbon domain-containing protein [Clostridiales bacterium]